LQDLIELHGAPLLATTLMEPGEVEALNDPERIRERFQHELDAVIGAGPCPDQPTTVIDLVPMGTGGNAVLVRQGRGDPSVLGL
jgi:tRNA A37 threonylcarbamoyladenosine synthetase subunit TsaC/SUA5/YrdC